MKILQFAYGHDANNVNLPHFYTPDSIAYTGTHDNVTTRGWLESLPRETAPLVEAYFDTKGGTSAWPIIKAALATVSRLAVIPMQDLMDLPASCTLNQPGTSEGNWQWRYTDQQLSKLRSEGLDCLRRWILLYDRTGTRTIRDYSEHPETHS